MLTQRDRLGSQNTRTQMSTLLSELISFKNKSPLIITQEALDEAKLEELERERERTIWRTNIASVCTAKFICKASTRVDSILHYSGYVQSTSPHDPGVDIQTGGDKIRNDIET